ncbi:MAG: ATP-binding protein [Deltaproteobacteria bacterium]|nr:ATP-binding protein [Deltaproteobacteria bacterium]
MSGFKGIGPAAIDLPLAKLTVVVGENGVGKSSLWQALALTAQSATEQLALYDIVLAGSKWRYPGRIDEIYHRHDPSKPLSVGIDMSASLAGAESIVSYTWTRVAKEEQRAFKHEFSVNGAPIWTVGWLDLAQAFGERRFEANNRGERVSATTPFSFDRVLDEQMLHRRELAGVQHSKNVDDLVQTLRPIFAAYKEQFRKTGYLEALRGKALVALEPGDSNTVGPHGEQLVRVLNNIQARERRKDFSLVRKWAENYGLPHLDSGMQTGGLLSTSAADPQTETSVRIHDFADGAFQGLLLAAQLFLSEPGTLVMIDEPESNLHPRFEKLMAEMLVEAANNNKQLLVSTHSEVLVAALSGLVRSGKIGPQNVAIHELARTDQGLVLRQLDMSSRGLTEWVKSFSAVDDDLNAEWIDGLPE